MAYTIKTLFISLLLFYAFQTQGQGFLATPIAGEYGRDFIIVNYLDWGVGSKISDHHCGTKTYNGHEGTDFQIKNFASMDSGVNVLAAADGRVVFVQDHLFDREKTSVISKGFGNYVAISHPNGYQTYYAHLKKNSAKVKVGDQVIAGDILGQVGSSGNSTDPHLHFELWYDSSFVVDPFSGACGNKSSLWKNELNYDTNFQIWSSGFIPYVPTLNLLRENTQNQNYFYDGKDSVIAYWNVGYGLQKSDTLTLEWYTPDGVKWFDFGYRPPNDLWYFYFWSYINVPQTTNSKPWKTILYKNNMKVDELLFYVNAKTNSDEIISLKKWILYPNPSNGTFSIRSTISSPYTITDMQGRVIKKISKLDSNLPIAVHLAKGVYFIKSEDLMQTQRIVIE